MEGMLAYWMSYFVFPSSPDDVLNNNIFAGEILSAKGERLALVPSYLEYLFNRLDECVKK